VEKENPKRLRAWGPERSTQLGLKPSGWGVGGAPLGRPSVVEARVHPQPKQSFVGIERLDLGIK